MQQLRGGVGGEAPPIIDVTTHTYIRLNKSGLYYNKSARLSASQSVCHKQMPFYFGRVTHPDYRPIPDVDTLFVVRHQPDSKDRKVHVHLVIETELSHKKLRRAYREVYGLEDRMAVFFTDWN